MENHARYGEMIYGHKDNNLYVNLFIPSTLRWGDTQIEQQTSVMLPASSIREYGKEG